MEGLKNRAKAMINKWNGNTTQAKLVTFNNATIAANKGNTARLEAEAGVYHYIKQEEKKSKGFKA